MKLVNGLALLEWALPYSAANNLRFVIEGCREILIWALKK